MYKTRKLIEIAMFVTLGTVLHVMEATVPNPLPLPGAKLGLANIVTLLALIRYGFKTSIAVALMRVLFGSLLSGTFLSPGFMLSLSGAFVSTGIMNILYYFVPAFSVIGISIIGAAAHNMGQLMAASLLVQTKGIFYYLPFLLIFSLPAGFSTGLITKLLLPYLQRE